MLLFVHGINAYASEWEPFVNYFSKKNYSCKAINLREGLDLRKTHFRDYVDKVKAMTNPEDILIGHSMGGLIVQKIAEETTIKAGIAICPAPPKGIKLRNVNLSTGLRYLPNIIIKKSFKPSYALCKKLFYNSVDEKKAKMLYEKLGEESNTVVFELFMDKIAVDETKVNCPLLFIATKNDRSCTPEMVQEIANKYDSKYEVYNGCHEIFVNWQDIADGILNFITRL